MSGAFPSYSDALLAVRMPTAVKVGNKKQRAHALMSLKSGNSGLFVYSLLGPYPPKEFQHIYPH